MSYSVKYYDSFINLKLVSEKGYRDLEDIFSFLKESGCKMMIVDFTIYGINHAERAAKCHQCMDWCEDNVNRDYLIYSDFPIVRFWFTTPGQAMLFKLSCL